MAVSRVTAGPRSRGALGASATVAPIYDHRWARRGVPERTGNQQPVPDSEIIAGPGCDENDRRYNRWAGPSFVDFQKQARNEFDRPNGRNIGILQLSVTFGDVRDGLVGTLASWTLTAIPSGRVLPA